VIFGDDPRTPDESRITPAAVGMCLPMRGRDRVAGALCVTRFEGEETFRRDAVDLGILLGGEVSRALERDRAAEERIDLERGMMRRDKLATLGEMASGVAHEINNPLGYVSSNLASLTGYINDILPVIQRLAPAEPGLDLDFILSDLPQCLQETSEGVKRVLEIADNLKTLAREDSEEMEAASINRLLDGAVAVAWNQMKYKAELTREYGDLPDLHCYPAQLGQLFLNLLHNAVQAIERDGHIILRTAADDGHLVVEVEDDGCGISPEVKKKIFDPFFTTKPQGAGTGLGLSIARKIVERHAGTIVAKSQAGRGSIFRVNLPRR
jgi:signal transduction histidine kinase